jgi:4-amino-4-deoxy-L-arabinose transferase-like glycosyltransferase
MTALETIVLPRPAPAQRRGGAHRARPARRAGPLAALAVILALQAALSVRLLRQDTAFGDEALYLWAGHLQWAYWLHGTNSVTRAMFPTWFSGSPVIYPPLGAMADRLGGLTGARLLSLGFMLGTTACLHGTTGRLVGRRAALLAALTFVILAPTQDLGAFATYDAMALFLLALATWTGVTAARRRSAAGRVALLVAAAGLLVAADATKYATALWDPVAMTVIGVACWQRRGPRAGLAAGLTVLGAWLVTLAGALLAGGRPYWQGILQTTVARTASDAPATAVLHQSFTLVGLVVVLVLLALVTSIGATGPVRALCGAAVVAVLLAPVNQARIHTTVSLHKHVDFGAWFAAIAAGHLLARISRIDRRRGWSAAVGLAIVVPGLAGSAGEARDWARYWPNSAGMVAALRPVVRPGGGRYLFEEFDVAYYYLHGSVRPGQIDNMFGFLYWDPRLRRELGGDRAFRAAISERYFTVVEVDGQNIPAAAAAVIESTLAHTSGYRLIYTSYWGPARGEKPARGRLEIWRLMSRGNAS